MKWKNINHYKEMSYDELTLSIAYTYRNYVLVQNFEAGVISKEDLFSDKNPLDRLLREHLSDIKENSFKVVMAYKDNLLEEARNAVKEDELEIASVFYSMHFEHAVNELLKTAFFKCQISEGSQEKLMYLNLEPKVTWLFELLALPVVDKSFVRFLKHKFGEKRNSFVHYKLPVKDLEDESPYFDVKEVEKYVVYFTEYRDRIFYGNEKTKIMKRIDQLVLKNMLGQ